MLELDSKPVHRLKHHTTEKVFLLPGQWYFGAKGATIRTLLGSCVAITLWNPKHRVGGMCHFLLPNRPRPHHGPLDGRFGDEALKLLADHVARTGTHTKDFEAHLYGGADTMPDQAKVKFNIGERNVEKAWELLDHYGFQLQCVDVGGNEPRSVILDLTNGEVLMRRGRPGHQKGVVTK